MQTRPLRMLLSTIGALLCVAALAPVAGAVTLGIGDNNNAMFSDGRFLALHIHQARITVPWDVATRRADRSYLGYFSVWLSQARADGVTPLVSFTGDGGAAGNYIPSVSVYRRAVSAFVRRFPSVRTYTAWNEPDWPYRPALSRNPRLAAGYFNTLVSVCHCSVAAGDVFLPAPQLGPWVRAYARALHHRPVAWALHDYTEVRGHSTAQIRTMLAVVSGPIWLDETGGILRRGHWAYRNQSAAAAARDESFMLSLAGRYHRITRIYHYMWQENPKAGWDSGLIDARGHTRPAYNVLLNYVRRHSARARAARR